MSLVSQAAKSIRVTNLVNRLNFQRVTKGEKFLAPETLTRAESLAEKIAASGHDAIKRFSALV